MGLMTGGENFERPQSSTTIENIKINMSESVSTNLAFDLKNISLLTTADQLIKICERKIRKQNQLSDDTIIGGTPWHKLKNRGAMNEDYEAEHGFQDLMDGEKEIVR